MSLDKLLKNIKKLGNCTLKNCDKETKALQLYHKDKIAPILQKIQTLDKKKDMNEIKLLLKKLGRLANNTKFQQPLAYLYVLYIYI